MATLKQKDLRGNAGHKVNTDPIIPYFGFNPRTTFESLTDSLVIHTYVTMDDGRVSHFSQTVQYEDSTKAVVTEVTAQILVEIV